MFMFMFIVILAIVIITVLLFSHVETRLVSGSDALHEHEHSAGQHTAHDTTRRRGDWEELEQSGRERNPPAGRNAVGSNASERHEQLASSSSNS
jgi:hypothetical protein